MAQKQPPIKKAFKHNTSSAIIQTANVGFYNLDRVNLVIIDEILKLRDMLQN